MKPTGAERITWICIMIYDKRHQSGASDTFNGNIERDGEVCAVTSSNGICWNCIFTSHYRCVWCRSIYHLDSDSPEGVGVD